MDILSDEFTIEENIEWIIKTFHEPTYDFIEKLNEAWYDFFYDHMEDNEKIKILNPLKKVFFNFTWLMLPHIEKEEEVEFPLLIKWYNDINFPIDNNVIEKIVSEHSEFDEELDELEKWFLFLNIQEDDIYYKKYKKVLDLFLEFKKECELHIKAEVDLLQKFINKRNNKINLY